MHTQTNKSVCHHKHAPNYGSKKKNEAEVTLSQ